MKQVTEVSESTDKALHIASVSKRIFIVEILEKEKGWNAISINLDTFDEAQSFFDDHKTDYFHGEIRIVQVYAQQFYQFKPINN